VFLCLMLAAKACAEVVRTFCKRFEKVSISRKLCLTRPFQVRPRVLSVMISQDINRLSTDNLMDFVVVLSHKKLMTKSA
jgi:hypothetical protein